MKGEGDRRQGISAASGAVRRLAPAKSGKTKAKPISKTKLAGASSRKLAASSQWVDDPLHFHVSPHWLLFAPCIVAALLYLALTSWSLPSGISAIMALSAIVLAACSRLFLKLERKLQAERRYGYAVMFAAIGLPTFFLGIALSRWTFDQETLGWDMTVPALAMLSLVAATLLNGRLISLVVAMLGMWAGASVFGSTTASLLALLFCGLGGSLHIDHASPI